MSSDSTNNFSKESFIEFLQKVEEIYLNNHKLFLIDISSNDMVLFQLVHRKVREGGSESDEFGYVIHLAFDKSFDSTIKQLRKFKSEGYAEIGRYHEWDGIPTYQIDLHNDYEEIASHVEKIFKKVYGFETDEIFFEAYEM